MHGKTMREALQEARNYRDPTNEGGPGSGPQKDGASKPDDKSSPKARPKIDKVALQKDLEDKVTDGMIDIDHGKDGSMDMSKEYEGGQDYEVDRDVNAIKKDLMSKGISEKDIEIDIEEDEEYINLNVSVKGKPVSEGIDEGGPGSGPQKGGKKQSSANIKKAYGILNDPRFKQGNYSGAAKAIDKLSPGLSNHPDVKNAMKRANEELDEAAFSQAQIDTLKQKYSGLSGSEKNGIQMDKLAKIMKRYPSGHLNQLAKLDIPMVSKVAKAMTEGGPGSGPQKGGGSSGDGRGDYKKSSKDALALKKYKSKFSHLKNDPLKIPGASKHMPADKSKRVSMKKTPRKFGGDYYDQEDREELAHRVKFHHLGGKSFAGKAPDWQLKKYGITDDGKLKTGWKPDDQLKG